MMVAVGLLVALGGCPAGSPLLDRVDAGGPEARLVDAGLVDAGPPAPVLSFEVRLRVDGGWQDLPLPDAGWAADVDAADALEVRATLPLDDFRFRIFDWRDAVVVSDETIRVDDAGTSWLVDLPAPLATGRGYTLRLEGQRGDVVRDLAGRTWPDWELAIRVRGDVQPEPKPARRRRR